MAFLRFRSIARLHNSDLLWLYRGLRILIPLLALVIGMEVVYLFKNLWEASQAVVIQAGELRRKDQLIESLYERLSEAKAQVHILGEKRSEELQRLSRTLDKTRERAPLGSKDHSQGGPGKGETQPAEGGGDKERREDKSPSTPGAHAPAGDVSAEEIQNRLKALAAEASTSRQETSRLRLANAEMGKQLRTHAARSERLRKENEALHARLTQANHALASLQGRWRKLEEDYRSALAGEREQERKSKEFKEISASLESQVAQMRLANAEMGKQLRAQAARSESLREENGSLRSRLRQADGERAALRERLERGAADHKAAVERERAHRAKVAELLKKEEEAGVRLAEYLEELEALRAVQARDRSEKAKLQEEFRRAQENDGRLKGQLREIRRELAAARKELARREALWAALGQVAPQGAGGGDPPGVAQQNELLRKQVAELAVALRSLEDEVSVYRRVLDPLPAPKGNPTGLEGAKEEAERSPLPASN